MGKYTHEKVIRVLQRFANRPWYTPLVFVLAALDNFVFVIPNDGILISSAMLTPRRWLAFAVFVAIGSTVGAIALASLVDVHGLPWIANAYPGIVETEAWAWSSRFFEKYGLLFVFFLAITPLVQQPGVIVASLADIPLIELASAIFFGRLIKYVLLAYLGACAPQLLSKLWGAESELKHIDLRPQSGLGSKDIT